MGESMAFHPRGRVKLSIYVLCPQLGLLYKHWMTDREPWWNDNCHGKTEVFGEKLSSVPICQSQMPPVMPRLNPGLCSDKMVTNHLGYAIVWCEWLVSCCFLSLKGRKTLGTHWVGQSVSDTTTKKRIPLTSCIIKHWSSSSYPVASQSALRMHRITSS
jgi:hypothetical protein